MMLYLTDTEVAELRRVLAARRDELLNEIAHADARVFKSELRARYELLSGLEERIERANRGEGAYA